MMLRGFSGFGGGFGLDVPYTKPNGDIGAAALTANASGTCGSLYGVQQILTDLGFYSGKIDGQMGSGTFTALRTWSESTGGPYTKGTYPNAATCQALMSQWAAKSTPAPAPVQTAAPAQSQSYPSAGVSTSPVSAPVSTASAGGSKVAVLSSSKVNKALHAAVTGTRAPGSGGGPLAWFQAQSTPVKAAVVGGGVLAVGGIAYLAFGRKTATPNRRRRR